MQLLLLCTTSNCICIYDCCYTCFAEILVIQPIQLQLIITLPNPCQIAQTERGRGVLLPPYYNNVPGVIYEMYISTPVGIAEVQIQYRHLIPAPVDRSSASAWL